LGVSASSLETLISFRAGRCAFAGIGPCPTGLGLTAEHHIPHTTENGVVNVIGDVLLPRRGTALATPCCSVADG